MSRLRVTQTQICLNVKLNNAFVHSKRSSIDVHFCFVFNVPPTATRPRLKVSSDRLVNLGIEPATPGSKGKRFIHYTLAAPIDVHNVSNNKITWEITWFQDKTSLKH